MVLRARMILAGGEGLTKAAGVVRGFGEVGRKVTQALSRPGAPRLHDESRLERAETFHNVDRVVKHASPGHICPRIRWITGCVGAGDGLLASRCLKVVARFAFIYKEVHFRIVTTSGPFAVSPTSEGPPGDGSFWLLSASSTFRARSEPFVTTRLRSLRRLEVHYPDICSAPSAAFADRFGPAPLRRPENMTSGQLRMLRISSS